MILFIYFVNFINNFYTSRVKFVTSYTLSQTMIQQEWISQWSATSSLENSGTRGDRCVTVVCKWALGLTTAATAIELESRERKPAQINFHSPRILPSLCRLESTNNPTRKPALWAVLVHSMLLFGSDKRLIRFWDLDMKRYSDNTQGLGCSVVGLKSLYLFVPEASTKILLRSITNQKWYQYCLYCNDIVRKILSIPKIDTQETFHFIGVSSVKELFLFVHKYTKYIYTYMYFFRFVKEMEKHAYLLSTAQN